MLPLCSQHAISIYEAMKPATIIGLNMNLTRIVYAAWCRREAWQLVPLIILI